MARIGDHQLPDYAPGPAFGRAARHVVAAARHMVAAARHVVAAARHMVAEARHVVAEECSPDLGQGQTTRRTEWRAVMECLRRRRSQAAGRARPMTATARLPRTLCGSLVVDEGRRLRAAKVTPHFDAPGPDAGG